MQNEFNFLNKIYSTEKELGIALHENFGDAMNYVFSDTFVDSINNSYLKGRVLVELGRCKYAESALTMIIYLLNPEIGLSIRGQAFKTLEDLANYMDNNDKLHETIVHLFSDHGVSQTLGDNLEAEEKAKLVDIENNILEPAIYHLFQMIYEENRPIEDYHGLSKYDYYFYAVTTSNDPFLAYYDVLNNLTFKADLMRNYPIQEVISSYLNVGLPYIILKDLKPMLKLDTRILLTSGIHFWLASHLKYYKTRSLASKVKKLMKKTLKKTRKPNIEANKFVLATRMFKAYDLFVKLSDLGLVKTKKPEYALNKANALRVCDAYNTETKYHGKLIEVEMPLVDKKERKLKVQALAKEFKEIKKN